MKQAPFSPSATDAGQRSERPGARGEAWSAPGEQGGGNGSFKSLRASASDRGANVPLANDVLLEDMQQHAQQNFPDVPEDERAMRQARQARMQRAAPPMQVPPPPSYVVPHQVASVCASVSVAYLVTHVCVSRCVGARVFAHEVQS